MAKEDSRAELEYDIRSLEKKIADIQKQGTPDMSELNKLMDLLEEKEEALNELTMEGEYNTGVNIEQAELEEEEQKSVEVEVIKAQEEHEISMAHEEEDKKRREEEQENAKLNSNNEIETEEVESDANKMTLIEWEKKTGISIVPDEAIKAKYPEKLSEQDFKDILANENVPKIINEPGKADEYLKSAEDWDSVKTSKSAIAEATSKNQFAENVYNESYILMEYDKEKIVDTDEKGEEGYGKIDKDELKAALDGKSQDKDETEKMLDDIEEGVDEVAMAKEKSNLSHELLKPFEEEQEIEEDDFGEIKSPYKP